MRSSAERYGVIRDALYGADDGSAEPRIAAALTSQRGLRSTNKEILNEALENQTVKT
jgi:hypothetical protein